MNTKEIKYSQMLLDMSNAILDYVKQNGLKSFNDYKKEGTNNEENNNFLEQEQEQEQFINADTNKVEIVSSQKENNNILPLIIGGWILYKILK